VTPSYLLNIHLLVYGFDDRDPKNQERDLELLDRVGRRPHPVSLQERLCPGPPPKGIQITTENVEEAPF
jgi:hypothetical protein